MTLLDRVAGALGDGGPDATQRYRCLGCGETFRSVARREDVACPNCGVTRVYLLE